MLGAVMKHVHTVIGRTYVVTTTVPCTICTPGGVLVTNCEPGGQTNFVSPTKGIVVSDDAARVVEAFRSSAAAASGSSLKAYVDGRIAEVSRAADEALQGGAQLTQQLIPLQQHAESPAAHLSADERVLLESLFAAARREAGPALPEGALSHAEIRAHFRRNLPGYGAGCGAGRAAVCVARLPLPLWDEVAGAYLRREAAVDEAVCGCTRHLMGAPGAEASGQDASGADWLFLSFTCHAAEDAEGVLHPAALPTPEAPAGSPATFGPAFYFFCCEERYYDSATGRWFTQDGSGNGRPLFQLWGVADCAWAELDEARRAELLAHGVREQDWRLWPGCLMTDAATGERIPRPCWCTATDEDGSADEAAAAAAIAAATPSPEPLLRLVHSAAWPSELPATWLCIVPNTAGALAPQEAEDAPPPPVLCHCHGSHVRVQIHLSEAEHHTFRESTTEIDLAELRTHPRRYLRYVPQPTRRRACEQAELLLRKLRAGNPVVPVPSYREGVAVCKRAEDEVALLSGLALGGLTAFELAGGERVTLSADEIRAILHDLCAADTHWQQALVQCQSTISAAPDDATIATALAEFATLLSGYAVEPLTNAMNTQQHTSWLAGLLTGWGIKESWAKIIAGSIAGALAAAGFLTSCTPIVW